MSRYRPDPGVPTEPLAISEYLDRQLWRISQAIEQQFDNEPVWDDIRVPIGGFQPGSVGSPGLVTFKGNIETYGFDGIASDEYLHFSLQAPHGWKEGSTLKPHIHWTTVDVTTNAAVVWTLEYTRANRNGIFPAPTTMTATGSCSATGVHRITEFPDITCSDGAISFMLLGRIGRNPAVAGDTFAHDALILELDFHAQFDGGGSVKPTTK